MNRGKESVEGVYGTGEGRALRGEDGLVLLVDAGFPHLRTACLFAGGVRSERTAEARAEDQLAKLVEETLSAAGKEIKDVDTFLYQAGPGSLLGLRIAAMMIETWVQVRKSIGEALPQRRFYHHFALLGEALGKAYPSEDLLLCSDARRKSWNVFRQPAGPTAGEWGLWEGEAIGRFTGRRFLVTDYGLTQDLPEGVEPLPEAFREPPLEVLWEKPLTGSLRNCRPALLREAKYLPWTGKARVKGS